MPEVLTPFGKRSSDTVIAVPKGGQIVHDKGGIIVLDGAGKPVHRGQRSNKPIGPPPPTSRSDQNIWNASVTWDNTSNFPIESFTTNWRVPPYPLVDDNQSIFIYSAAQPADYSSALLPILQYGPSAAGGANTWAVATWYMTSAYVYHTCLTQVEIGDPLHAAIHLTYIRQLLPPTYDYTARFKGIDDTVLSVRYSQELKDLALGVQGRNVSSEGEYPPGVTLFYPTDVSLVPDLAWKVSGEQGAQVSLDVNTAVNGEISFRYIDIVN